MNSIANDMEIKPENNYALMLDNTSPKHIVTWWKYATALVSVICLILAILLGVFARSTGSSSAATSTISTSTKNEWLKQYAAPIDSTTISSTDNFNDLSASLKFLANKSVVFLGENEHGDGTSSQLRGRVITYLHQQLGFNTLAWEIGPHDGFEIMTKLLDLNATYTSETIFQIFKDSMSISPQWGFAEDTQPIFNYIAQSLSSSNPLELVGYDYGGTGNFPTFVGGSASTYPALKSFLDQAIPTKAYPNQTYFTILERITNNEYLIQTTTVPPQSEIDFFFETLNITLNYLTHNLNATIHNYTTWVQIYNQTGANARDQLIYGPACNFDYITCTDSKYLLNNRDQQMADNLLRLLRKDRSNIASSSKRKIIVWTHNSHASRSPNSYYDPGHQYIDGQNGLGDCKGKTPCETLRAGEVLHNYIDSEMYSMANIVYQGPAGNNNKTCSFNALTHVFSPCGSLEYDMHIAGFNKSAFLDFSRNPIPTWLQEYYTTSYFEHQNVGLLHLTNVYDGIFYIDNSTGVICH